MPNKQQSRTRSKRKTNGSRPDLGAVGPVWPTGPNTPEVKAYTTQSSNAQLYHNVPVYMANTLSLFDSITQGAGFGQRIGSRIFAKRLRVRVVFNNKVDRPNCSYRVAVTAAPTNSNTDAFNELFSGGGFTGIHAITNSQLLYDTVFPLNQGSGMENNVTPNKERSFNHTLEIPLNHPVVYNTADNKATTTLTVWFVSYDAYGTLITDNISSVAQVTWSIDYTDA